ncbi:hypothetical protein INR49_014410 [Caranx melampygus]|nr:hypothetical protein INR49_014410 [Caranx melampygus]
MRTLTMANGGLALDQCTERQGSPSLPFHWARIGRDAARSHVVEPSTLPLSHPVGDSCSANEPGDTTLPLPCRKDGQQLYLCGGGRGNSCATLAQTTSVASLSVLGLANGLTASPRRLLGEERARGRRKKKQMQEEKREEKKMRR